MKKIFYLLMLIMFIPSTVLADAAAPTSLSYDALIINKEGCFDDGDSEIIPNKTIVHVYSTSINGDDSVYAYVKGNSDKVVEIGLECLIPYEKEFTPTDKDADEKNDDSWLNRINEKIIVYEKTGVKLNKGPAVIYEKYNDTIPYLKELKVTYRTYGTDGWYYVDDGNYKGWIQIDSNIKIAYNIGTKLLFNNVKVRDENDKEIFTLTKGTLLRDLYHISNTDKWLVYYNGKKGYINLEKDDIAIGEPVNGEVLSIKEIKLESVDGKSTLIPAGKEITILYADSHHDEINAVNVDDKESFYYVKYNNVEGFINSDDVVQYDKYQDDVMLFYDTIVVDENNKYLFTIPKETIIEKDNWYCIEYKKKFYVKYNGQQGFIGNLDEDDKEYWKDFNYGKNNGNKKILTLQNTQITSFDGKVKTTVDSNEILNIYTGIDDNNLIWNIYDSYYYVDYKGTKGYVRNENILLLDGDFEVSKIKNKKDTKFYNLGLYNYLISGDSEKISDSIKEKYLTNTVIKKDIDLDVYKKISYISNNKVGKENNTKNDLYLIKYNNEYGLIFTDNETIIEKEIPSEEIKDDKTISKNEKNPIMIIILAVLGAFVLAITSFITIKVINKKKKNNDKTKDEKDLVGNNKKR